jgi:hypothetical protein
MRIARAAHASLVAFAALTLALGLGAGAQGTILTGTVGPGFTIRLVDGSGNAVRNLAPGAYTIKVEDKSPEHNFHLTGPGVNQATDIEETGSFAWNVTFQDGGRYHFQCDPHAATMNGDFTDFTAGSAPPPPTTTAPTPPPPASVPAIRRYAASVGPGKRIAVTRVGATARLPVVKAGAAVLVVSDRSATDNFHLTGPGVNRLTGKAARGTFTWRLALKPGLYRYRSDATPTLKGSFRVTAA